MDMKFLSLKWNNHWSTFFTELSVIRKKEVYNDVTLACNGNFFPAHKLVLSVCSDYFKQIFERIYCKHPVIVLKDINCTDLEALLNYMYDGEVSVLQENLAGLIKAAECLKIKGLAISNVDETNKSSINNDLNNKTKRTSSEESVSDIKKRRCDSGGSDKANFNDLEQNRKSDKLSGTSTIYIKEENDDSSSLPFQEKINHRKKSEDHTCDDVICVDEPNDVKVECDDSYVEFDPSKEEEYSEDANVDYSYMEGEMSQQYEDIETSNNDGSLPSLLGQDSTLQNPGELYENFAEGGETSQAQASSSGTSGYSPLLYSSLVGHNSNFFDNSYHDQQDTAKIFSCRLCSYKGKWRSNLNRHMLIHTGAKPYKCSFCSFRSTQRVHIKTHIICRHAKY